MFILDDGFFWPAQAVFMVNVLNSEQLSTGDLLGDSLGSFHHLLECSDSEQLPFHVEMQLVSMLSIVQW